MTGRKVFEKGIALSQKNKWLQFFYEPWGVLKLFLFTRLAQLISSPIKWQAKLFWGDNVKGYFPDATFNALYLYHFMEAKLTEVVLKYLKPGMVFVDIGSYVGYYTLLASHLVGDKGKVFSFEPTQDTYGLLLQNTKGVSNILTEHLAVWSKNKTLKFLDYGNFYASCNSYTHARMSKEILAKAKPKKVSVKAVNLDDYFRELKARPGFVKIDAESAEYEILLGMRQILLKDRPTIAMEIGDREEEIGKTQKCLRLLEKLDYKALEWSGGKVQPFQPRNSYLHLYDNLLFLPK